MTRTDEKAYAKLNISLDITGKLPDGYHAMRMVMQSCSLCDELEVSLREDGGFSCQSDLPYLPTDERNLTVKAARLFMETAKITDKGVHIDVKKRIPVCAGLGGGSSDAAATLRALNRLTGAGFSRKELEKMGEGLGSDVPYCVAGGTVLAEGKGEILTPLVEIPDFHAIICKPEFSISTPELFAQVSCAGIKLRPDTQGIIQALESGDLARIARRMYNVFEDILPQRYGEVFKIKDSILGHGALGAAMTGTGSAVFGLFEDEAKARAAHKALRSEYKSCFLCHKAKASV